MFIFSISIHPNLSRSEPSSLFAQATCSLLFLGFLNPLPHTPMTHRTQTLAWSIAGKQRPVQRPNRSLGTCRLSGMRCMRATSPLMMQLARRSFVCSRGPSRTLATAIMLSSSTEMCADVAPSSGWPEAAKKRAREVEAKVKRRWRVHRTAVLRLSLCRESRAPKSATVRLSCERRILRGRECVLPLGLYLYF